MRRLRVLLLLVLLLPAALSAALLTAVNTEPGRAWLARGLAELTGGQVRLAGLAGAIPFAPRVARLELWDPAGAWLVVEGAALEIAVADLLRGRLGIASLTTRRATWARWPALGSEGAGPPGLSVPIPIRLGHLAVEALAIDAILPGAPVLAAGAAAALGTNGNLQAFLDLAAAGGSRYRLALARAAGRYRLGLEVREAPGPGLFTAAAVAAGASPPVLRAPWRLAAEAEGPLTALALRAALAAGPHRAGAAGTLDLASRSASRLSLAADLAALTLTPPGGPALGWQRLSAQAELHGPLRAPAGMAWVDAAGLGTAEIKLPRLTAALVGGATHLGGVAVADGLSASRELPDDLARQPLWLAAELAHRDPARPVRLRLQHPLVDLAATGGLADRTGSLELALPDLSGLVPGWAGRLRVAAEGTAGSGAGLAAGAQLRADLALAADKGLGGGEIAGRLSARVADPNGALALDGRLAGDWAGAPVAAQLSAGRQPDGAWSLSFGDSRWAGLSASGALEGAPGGGWPTGQLAMRAERLVDLDPLVAALLGIPAGEALGGRIAAQLTLPTAGVALIEADADRLVLPGSVRAETLRLSGRLTDGTDGVTTQARLALAGLAAPRVGGDLTLTADGPVGALDLAAEGRLTVPSGPLGLSAAMHLDGQAQRLALRRLEVQAQGETLRLVAPATLALGDGLAVDRLRLRLGAGRLDLAGRLAPRLGLEASISTLPLDLVRLIAPELALAGTLAAEAQLRGDPRAPSGVLRAEATGVRLISGGGRAVPPAEVRLEARLAPNDSSIDARLAVGDRARLRLTGKVGGSLPMAPGRLALRAEGQGALGLLDPWLAAAGRQVDGQAWLAADVTGTARAPRVAGRLRLAEAALRDRTIGLSLTGIEGSLVMDGETLGIERLVAQAGPGTLALTGRVGLLVPGTPVDLRLIGRRARPLQLDLVSFEGDLDLGVRGGLAEGLLVTGEAALAQVEIRLPERRLTRH